MTRAQKEKIQRGYKWARTTQRLAVAVRSVTMSNMAPKRDDCPRTRAAYPSTASRRALTP
eukprot:CAMPEP_0185187910 /NCGR_PEP_ID=MMETSP1140-20130426/5067_1 /TAXON_ID=298111 /ORGANISM="Pavlova sp., Strain CCMP459" /LENGTH=59 /DNA_ID=CAMNT_0027754369 /DNA_START=963 /DNA_END=1142 /DNA_ORIENTATION=+